MKQSQPLNTLALFALTLMSAFALNVQIQAQVLPTGTDSTGLILPPVESLEVIRQSILNGGVQVNNGLDLSGNALFRNDAQISGKLNVTDIIIERDVRFTGLADSETPVDQWLGIDSEGKVIPVLDNTLINKVLSEVYNPQRACFDAEGVVNPPRWETIAGTKYLVTDECQPDTKVGINNQAPKQALDVNGFIQGNAGLIVEDIYNKRLELTSSSLDLYNSEDPLTINGQFTSGTAIEMGSTAKAIDLNVFGSMNLSQQLGLGIAPKERIHLNSGLTIGANFLGRNIYQNNGNKYLGLDGSGFKFSLYENSVGFVFFNEGNAASMGEGDEAATFNKVLLATYDKVGVNYSFENNLKAAFNIRRSTDTQDYLLIEDSQGTDKLKVASDGVVYAEEFKVTAAINFPDYVFEADYPLLSLKEVEQHIAQHGHLPNMPSADEVAADGGMGMGELQHKLLEKVEELTLYVLQQQQEIEALKAKLEAKDKEEKAGNASQGK